MSKAIVLGVFLVALVIGLAAVFYQAPNANSDFLESSTSDFEESHSSVHRTPNFTDQRKPVLVAGRKLNLFLKSKESGQPLGEELVRVACEACKFSDTGMTDAHGFVVFDMCPCRKWLAHVPKYGEIIAKTDAVACVVDGVAGWRVDVACADRIDILSLFEGQPIAGARILRIRPYLGPAQTIGVTGLDGRLTLRSYYPFDKYRAVHKEYVCVSAPRVVREADDKITEIRFEFKKLPGAKASLVFFKSQGTVVGDVTVELIRNLGSGRALRSDAESVLIDRSDKSGRWTSPFLMTSDYVIHARSPAGLVGHAAFAIIDAQDVHMKMTLTQGIALSGQVTRIDGKKIERGSVQLRDGAGSLLETVAIGPSGRYKIASVARGLPLWVIASARGCQEKRIQTETLNGDTTVDLHLEPEFSLGSARVVALDGKGWPGLRLYLYKRQDKQPSFSRVSDANGRVVFVGLEPGPYRCEIRIVGSSSLAGSVLDVQKITLPLTVEHVVFVSEDSLPSAWLKGRLSSAIIKLNANSKYPPSMELTRISDGSMMTCVISNPDGVFRLGPFAPGEYSFLVIAKSTLIRLPQRQLHRGKTTDIGLVEVPEKTSVSLLFDDSSHDGVMFFVNINGVMASAEIKQQNHDAIVFEDLEMGMKIRVTYKDNSGKSKFVEDIVVENMEIPISR